MNDETTRSSGIHPSALILHPSARSEGRSPGVRRTASTGVRLDGLAGNWRETIQETGQRSWVRGSPADGGGRDPQPRSDNATPRAGEAARLAYVLVFSITQLAAAASAARSPL